MLDIHNNTMSVKRKSYMFCAEQQQRWKTKTTQYGWICVSKVDKGNGYEAQQNSLLHVFVHFFGLDRAQYIIRFELCPSN